MLFTSTGFLIFLGIVFALYAIAPQKHRWFVLLVGSLTFYGFAGPSFLVYICATIVTTYCYTVLLRRLREKRDATLAVADKDEKKAAKVAYKRAAKKWFVAALVVNLGILAVVKYADFMIGNTNTVMGWFGAGYRLTFLSIAMPMGISFYTFQTVGYIIDVYREKAVPERNILKLGLFVSFFPQVIQGPISRWNDLSQTLYTGAQLNGHDFSRGAQRVLWGFFKKLVIADRLWPALDVLISNPDDYMGAFYLLSILLYAIILFCDFTGGLDITIGVAEMFGIKLAENFDRPFYSKSIQEYWHRWHITMYTWFRDYVFYPMSVGKSMLRLSKWGRRVFGDAVGKRLPVHISLIWVWFLTGFWHGATWNFIVWGLANGLVIMISLELQPLYKRFHEKVPWAGNSKIYGAFMIFRTFWIMNFIRSFDIYPGVGNTFRMMGSVFTRFGAADFVERNVSGLGLYTADYIAAGLGLCVVFWISYMGRGGVDFRDRFAAWGWPARYAVVGAILFGVLIFGAYGAGYDARQFIYNQF